LRHELINKKYHISYINNDSNKDCKILITTIDAFMWKLGNNGNDEINKFDGIINSIMNGYIKDNNINSIFCNGFTYKLNKETCIFIDESQDLSINYGKALIEIVNHNYVDLYVVGDKLQSIQNIENIFNYFINTNFQLIEKIIFPYINICRRFYQHDLINLVNNVINFSKYELPSISPYKIDDNIIGKIDIKIRNIGNMCIIINQLREHQ